MPDADQANFWGVAMWMGRLLHSYDYLRDDVAGYKTSPIMRTYNNRMVQSIYLLAAVKL